MPPNIIGNPEDLFHPAKTSIETVDSNYSNIYPHYNPNERIITKKRDREDKPTSKIVWRNVVIFSILHILSIYALFLLIVGYIKRSTMIYEYIYGTFTGLGITAGAHRLWSHRSYKAKLPLRIFLMLAQSAALQNNIYVWCRDHRVHHKFTETNADPHNASRGFFFSHIGWLLCRKHKDVIEKGKLIDMSDVLEDPVVQFQIKYYIPLIFIMAFGLPTTIVWYISGETFWICSLLNLFRYVLSLNATWLVNSAAHIWGMRPYERSIKPAENIYVSIFAYGEGWHNYHHVFPWDYKTAELGNYGFNFTTAFLDLMEKIGQATDLKTVPKHMIRKKVYRSGDGSWNANGTS
ncbi:acyl-CoA desaturase-like [Sitophilus oryzae]|uniref:Acyl-CoA desaturase-like n=1 Tax=Sitophilus oryzae TaxID=7048 RepID=A0A6J2YWH4_SITOR|nr:acyl-CoA desaturase-like [Sitophilus oryzae]XP_030767541.1 acyl-CoA desaturase-like [Sitophilus oryzae]